MKKKHLSSLAILMASLMASSALAASVSVPSDVPRSGESSRAGDRFRIQDRPAVERDSILTAPGEDGKEKPVKGGTTFLLKGIKFENLTAFSEADLNDIYASSIGKKISLQELNQIVAKITARYRNDGFILSRAVLPPQRIGDGVVTVRIVEGFVNKVVFQGLSETDSRLNAYADKIRNSKPLDAKKLERYLLLMEDLPGVSARATIQPAKDVPGASDIVVNITQRPVDVALSVDNRGSRFLGQQQGTLTLGANNLLGLHDRTQFRGVLTAETDELRFAELSHDELLGTEGTKLTLSASFTQTQPGSTLEIFDIEGQNRFYLAQVTHPFLRSRQSNFIGNLTFDYRDADVDILGVKFYEDRLRVLRAGASYDFVDGWMAINRMDVTFSKGLGWDDDSSNLIRSRSVGKTSFEKVSFNASRLQPISGPFGAYLAASGQASDAPLLSAEEFGIGGVSFGSAYDPSEITGDHGLAARVELQYSRSGDFAFVPSYQLYTFYDVGSVWNRHTLAGESDRDSLASTGIGSRFNITDSLSGDVELAMPLTRSVNANGQDGEAMRGFFSLTWRY